MNVIQVPVVAAAAVKTAFVVACEDMRQLQTAPYDVLDVHK